MQARLSFAGAAMLLAGWLAAGPALAHSGTGLPGGFLSGFLHPLSGFDHLLAMVSVGLWGAFLGRPLIVALPVIFPTVMELGGALDGSGRARASRRSASLPPSSRSAARPSPPPMRNSATPVTC